jgi:hypothetical protein
MTHPSPVNAAWADGQTVHGTDLNQYGTAINQLGTLTNPLPVSAGGTGAVTLTGLLVGSGTNNITTTSAPVGALVGTTDTQTLSGKTVTGLILSPGTNTVAPITLTSGTNLTTPTAGAHEYDGVVFYQSPSSSTRTVVDGEQFCTLTGDYTLTSQTGVQKIFNASTNGAVTLPVGAWFFETFFSLTGLSATSGGFGFALGGAAVLTTQVWHAEADKCATSLATASTTATTSVNTAANTAISPANTNTFGWARIWGKLRVGTGGTVIPQISQATAAAAVVKADSYFRVWPVGVSAVTTVGNWS